jgi:hypothetical protein
LHSFGLLKLLFTVLSRVCDGKKRWKMHGLNRRESKRAEAALARCHIRESRPGSTRAGGWQADQRKSGRGWHHHSRAPQSPVNGAGGITGCGEDAPAKRSFQARIQFF